MNVPFVTVIMPVYNAEATVEASIDSLLAQTYGDWKLICINDGSKDRSLEILERYAASDPRIIVVSQENGGVAAARKTGYLLTESPYVINLDADDEFSENLLEACVQKAHETDADILVPNCICETSESRSFSWNDAYGYTTDTVMTGLEAFSRTFIPATMHGYLMWKTALIKAHACGEDQTLLRTFSEDEYYRRVLFLNSHKVCFCGGYYIYRSNSDSITKKFSAQQIGYLVTARQMVELNEEYAIPTDLQHLIEENYMRTVISLQIKYDAFRSSLSAEEATAVKSAIKYSYHDALRYRKHIHFADKPHAALYRWSALSGYFVFRITCRLMAKKKYA